MDTQIVGAIGLAAALVAVYYAWRTAHLARHERQETRLRTLVEAVLEVRKAADEVFVAYDLGRTRAETTAVVFAFHQAQDRLRLAVESGHLPAALVEDEAVLERLRALLDRRPLNVVKAAGALLGDPRMLRAPRAGAASLKRALRITRPCLLPDVEPARRPSGGCAVQTATTSGRCLEMVVPAPAPHPGLVRLRRCVEDPDASWDVSPPFATSLGSVDAVSLCLGSRRSPESLEIIARTGGAPHHLSLPAAIAQISAADEPTCTNLGVHDAAGVPAIVQGAFGNRGNLEVVTPTLGGRLAHLWRDNDHRDTRWERNPDFGGGGFDSVAL